MSDNWKMQDDDAAMPIGTGTENTTSEIPFPADKKPRVQGMTAVLTLVFMGGLAVIYAVGLLHKPRAADAAQAETDNQINTALQQLVDKTGGGNHLKNMFADTDKLVRMFYEYPGKASLPVEALPGNPFEHLAPARVHDDPIQPIIPHIDNSGAEEERMRKLAESFAQLKLQTVMVSTGLSMAQINGKLVQVGGKVGEFTVDSIESKRVIVRSGEHKFELLLDQPRMDQP
jgi:hypothetical protein